MVWSRVRDWYQEVPPEEVETAIDEVAKKIVEYEMDLPATFFLGAFWPMSYICGQLIRVILSPYAAIFGRSFDKTISIFEKSENIKKLIQRINVLEEIKREEEKKNKIDRIKSQSSGLWDWLKKLNPWK